MSAPSEAAPVWHYDGVRATRRTPLLVPDGQGFVLDEAGSRDGPYRFDSLVALGHRGEFQYGYKDRSGWRIGFIGAPPAEIAALLPGARRYGGLIDRFGLWPTAAGFAVASAIVLFVIASMPSVLARIVPRAFEARLGQLMVGDFGGRTCSTPEGDAALAKLAGRMSIGAEPADIRVVDIPMVNAITLPGGYVLLFRGLLTQAQSPEEIAGVLGHELGHVEHRHVLQSLLRQLGLSVLLGGLNGDVAGYTNLLLSANYSRRAENQADGYAIDQLGRAGISPSGAAGFFDRLSKGEMKAEGIGAVAGYMASHPASAERKARFAAATKGRYAPVLSPTEWAQLRDICRGRSADWRDALGI